MDDGPCQTLSDSLRELRICLRYERGAQTTVDGNALLRARHSGIRTFQEPHSVVATECIIFHRGGIDWRQATVAVAHQLHVEVEQGGVARLARNAKRRRLVIAPTPVLNVLAETVHFVDVDADAVAVARMAADLSVPETLLTFPPQTTNCVLHPKTFDKHPSREHSYKKQILE